MPDSVARRQQRVDDLIYRLAQAQSQNLARLRRRHVSLDTRLRHQDMRVRLTDTRRQLERRDAALEALTARLLSEKTNRVVQLTASLSRATETLVMLRRSRWERIYTSLTALSPKAILSRGYALVFDAAGNLVKDASQLTSGDRVRAQLGHGEFAAEVKTITTESATE